MPISANPPATTVTALTIPIRHKRPNGNMRIKSVAKGTHINTASTALRISKSPNSRPASVKFTGITTVISSKKSLPKKILDFLLFSAYNIVKESKEFLTNERRPNMELAKITSKGQITIPIEIRKKLGVRDGDKVLFVEEGNRIYVTNSSIQAFERAQEGFKGVAEELGIKNDDDIVAMIKEIRAERNKQ